MSRPNSRQRVSRAFGHGSPSPYGRRANNFQDTWNTLRSGYGRPKRKRPYKGPEWRTPGHRNTLS